MTLRCPRRCCIALKKPPRLWRCRPENCGRSPRRGKSPASESGAACGMRRRTLKPGSKRKRAGVTHDSLYQPPQPIWRPLQNWDRRAGDLNVAGRNDQMATVYNRGGRHNRGGSYYVQWYDENGKRRTKSARARDKATARALPTDWRRMLHCGGRGALIPQ